MKVWITKYALSEGIKEVEAELCLDTDKTGNMIKCELISGFNSYFHGEGRDWHKTREAAIKKAEEMRQKKIESLKKQLQKLEKMRFE